MSMSSFGAATLAICPQPIALCVEADTGDLFLRHPEQPTATWFRSERCAFMRSGITTGSDAQSINQP